MHWHSRNLSVWFYVQEFVHVVIYALELERVLCDQLWSIQLYSVPMFEDLPCYTWHAYLISSGFLFLLLLEEVYVFWVVGITILAYVWAFWYQGFQFFLFCFFFPRPNQRQPAAVASSQHDCKSNKWNWRYVVSLGQAHLTSEYHIWLEAARIKWHCCHIFMCPHCFVKLLKKPFLCSRELLTLVELSTQNLKNAESTYESISQVV